jgi:hypothetical protein
MARENRLDVDPITLLQSTVDNLLDRDRLKKFSESMSSNAGDLPSYQWDETYLSNPVLGRLVSLKIADNCLYYAKSIGYANEMLQEDLILQLTASLPGILSERLGISGDYRDEVLKHSPGDLLFSAYIGGNPGIGSMLVSHPIGMGLAYFGYWMPLVLVLLFCLIFTICDSLYCLVNRQVYTGMPFAALAVASMTMLSDRHAYVGEIRFLVRTFWESGLIACTLTAFIISAQNLFGDKSNAG